MGQKGWDPLSDWIVSVVVLNVADEYSTFAAGCQRGWFGENCEYSCHMCANGAACNSQQTACECTAGWIGPTCNQPCPQVSTLHCMPTDVSKLLAVRHSDREQNSNR